MMIKHIIHTIILQGVVAFDVLIHDLCILCFGLGAGDEWEDENERDGNEVSHAGCF